MLHQPYCNTDCLIVCASHSFCGNIVILWFVFISCFCFCNDNQSMQNSKTRAFGEADSLVTLPLITSCINPISLIEDQYRVVDMISIQDKISQFTCIR